MDVTPSLADMAVQQLAEAFSGMARRPKASRRVKASGIVLAAVLSMLAPAARAASFDCGKAAAPMSTPSATNGR